MVYHRNQTLPVTDEKTLVDSLTELDYQKFQRRPRPEGRSKHSYGRDPAGTTNVGMRLWSQRRKKTGNHGLTSHPERTLSVYLS